MLQEERHNKIQSINNKVSELKCSLLQIQQMEEVEKLLVEKLGITQIN